MTEEHPAILYICAYDLSLIFVEKIISLNYENKNIKLEFKWSAKNLQQFL